jgi:hypothetical protein
MMRRRSASDMRDHVAISPIVRLQPSHSPDTWSITHTLMQGLSIAGQFTSSPSVVNATLPISGAAQ